MNRKYRRIGELDLVERFNWKAPPLLIQIAFGALCSVTAVAARLAVDLFAVAAGPYSLIYPAVLISTLFGRWQAGFVTWATSFLYAWYFVLPESASFAFLDPGDAPRTVVNGLAAAVIMVFAETFRRAVHRAVREREEEIRTRDLLLSEIDHRMKNNFAIVASLLNHQQQRVDGEEARTALSVAAARVHSIAAAHASLYARSGDLHNVEMGAYLKTLATRLREALFLEDDVTLDFTSDNALMPRDRAVAIGLVVNELVTNAAKHAFTARDEGVITIRFEKDETQWRLTVADNGCGLSRPSDGDARSGGGLGGGLTASFALMAGGELRVDSAPDVGTTAVLVGPVA